jgi:hypothetical protein
LGQPKLLQLRLPRLELTPPVAAAQKATQRMVAPERRPTFELMGTAIFFAAYGLAMVVLAIWAHRTFARD